MITILNRRKLMTDVNSGALVAARDALRAAGIPSELLTTRNQLRRDARWDAGARAKVNLPASTAAPEITFVYTLYVRRRDWVRARELLKIR